MDFDPYINLANAIVVSAVDDYKDAIRILRRKYGREISLEEIQTSVAADLERRRQEVEAENEAIKEANKTRCKSQQVKLKTVKITQFDKACSTLEEVKRFIGSKWYCFLTDLDPDVVLTHLQQVGG